MRRMRMRLAAALMLVCSLAVLAAGCGKDKKKTAKATTLTVAETAAGGKYKYTGVSDVPAGVVTTNFTNSDKVDHELQLLQANGKTPGQVLTLMKKLNSANGPTPIPDWLTPAGGTGTNHAGQTSSSTQVLEPGDYYAVDNSSPNNGGPAYVSKGAIVPFKVTGSSAGGGLPPTSASVTVKDTGKDKFAFSTSGLKAGKNTVTFNNRSKQLHHLIVFPLLPGKTVADAKKFLATQGKGAPPVDFNGGDSSAVLNGKFKQATELTLTKPGNYVLLCFLSDRDGKGKPHFLEGLLKEVKVG